MNLNKRVILTLYVGLCNILLLNAQPIINGATPFYDKRTNTYLLSIEQWRWGDTFEADVTLPAGSYWHSLTIDGNDVKGYYLFENIDANTTYEITLYANDSIQHSKLLFTYLPIVQIKGGFGYEYSDADVVLQMPEQCNQQMKAQIKWRGGTTNATNKNKRNYKIKFVDDNGEKKNYRFFGLRDDNTWILDAGQVDMFRMRNRIAADIWNEFASKPYYHLEEPKVLSASRGQMVEVFLNDQYQGVYNMCEPIDRKQMKLTKYEESTGDIHGGLWKATGWGYATFYDVPAMYDNTKEKWNVFEVKYPDVDDLSPSDYSTLYNAIRFVAASTDELFIDSVEYYFDIPVIADWYIFCNILNGFDICAKNIYWAVYDKQKSKKLTPAMWDMDCSMGQNYTNNPQRPDYVAPDYSLLIPTNIVYRLRQLNVNGFNEYVAARYHALRDGLLSNERLIGRYTEYYNMLSGCGAASREEARWSYDSDISGLKLSLSAELDYITQWIAERMEYLDSYWEYETVIEYVTDEHRGDGQRYNLLGFPVGVDYKGVVIVEGKKYLQR